MKKYNCIIIEDEPLAQERVKGFIDKTPFLELSGIFTNPMDSIDVLTSNNIDLIFLDVNLGEISGIQFIESIKYQGEIIITTAYPEHALKGFEMDVLDYLLKPFAYDRFLKAVQRLNTSENSKSSDKEFIFVKTESRLEKINIDNILFIEGMGDYRRIHCSDKKIMTLQTFSELEKELSGNKIRRVHKSYMVSVSKIESIERSRIKIGSELIPISDSYKDSFMKLIKN